MDSSALRFVYLAVLDGYYMETDTGTRTEPVALERQDLTGEIRRYWDERSRGYSLATRMGLNNKEDQTRRIIRESIPDTRRLCVLDIGTGAGYAAIILAQMGHDVTAVDNSELMLEKARANARAFRVDIQFVQADLHDLGRMFDAFQFDAIVAKDTMWGITDPVGAYSDWIHLVRPGGYILIIDGNYYLDIYDEEYAKRRRFYDMRDGKDNNLHAHTNIDGVDLDRIREIAKLLPLSRERRPAWDLSVLLGLGLVDFRVMSLDRNSYAVLTRDGMMKLPSRFSILARTPYEKTVDEDRTYVPDDMVTRLSERLAEKDVPEMDVLKALSDQKRVMLVLALAAGSMSVSQLSAVSGDGISSVSHNLKILKDANIVRVSKEGRESYYRLTDRTAIDAILSSCRSLMEIRR